jgi:monovalent cation:H+ antiporter-2, CPA2 family
MAMTLDPVLPFIVLIACLVLIVVLLMKTLKQPHVIAYIIVGIFLGFFGILPHNSIMSTIGSLGVILLLFFVGMHVHLPNLVKEWKIAIIGTTLQILVSLGLVFIVGYYLAWPVNRIILIGFVISISSTAVVLKILEQWGELKTQTGQDVLSILLVQDIAIVAMMIIISFLSAETLNIYQFSYPLIGGMLFILGLIYCLRNPNFKIPFLRLFKDDHDLEITVSLIFCFGLALISGIFGLSTALGAFVAGIILGLAKETQWVQESLKPIYTIFIGLFFIYVGYLLDLNFIWVNLNIVLLMVVLVLVTNTLINSFILKVLGRPWREAIYGGALLSQIGEFSFLLAAVGYASNLISDYGYQLTLSIIALTLLLTPLWLILVKKTLHVRLSKIIYRKKNS